VQLSAPRIPQIIRKGKAMKILSCALLLVASMAFVLLGCADNSGPVAGTTTNRNRAALALSKTTGSGAWVFKYGMYNAYGFLDANTGWMLVLGVNDLSSLCSGSGGMDWFTLNDIYLPNADPELRRNVYQLKGDGIATMAWRADTWPDDFCTFAASTPPAAVGTANLIVTDNDFYAPDQDNKNSNAWGRKANGRLIAPDGQVYQLNFVYRISWDGVDGARRNVVFKIQLTPAGGE
jgi:hypothetical protein